jgi:hypothetical protein
MLEDLSEDAAANPTSDQTNRPVASLPGIVCIAGRNELDEAAASLLVHLLRSEPTLRVVEALPAEALTSDRYRAGSAQTAPTDPAVLLETARHRPGGLPVPHHGALDAHVDAAQSEGPHRMGPEQQARGPVATQATHPSPVAQPALRRQTSKVGAGCGNAARPVRCGGCPVMAIPTAILVRVFRPVVQPLVLAMLNAWHDLSFGRALSRRRWTRTSSTIPVWSTARHNQCFTPAILSTPSSRCHLLPMRGSRRRIRLANCWSNLCATAAPFRG